MIQQSETNNNKICSSSKCKLDSLNVNKENSFPIFFLSEEFKLNNLTESLNFISIALNNKNLLSCSSSIELLNNSLITISADGASNILKEFDIKINYALGDLDSIFDDTITYLREKGITIEKYYCQDSTDLEKCFQKVLFLLENNHKLNGELNTLHLNRTKRNLLCVFGCCGGRIDHSFSNLSSSLKYSYKFKDNNFTIVSLSKSSITYYLPEGENTNFYFNPHLIFDYTEDELERISNYRKSL